MRGLVISGLAAALLGAWAVARAQGTAAARTWDFQTDALGAAPAGFSFSRTGQGREGKWVITQDPSAPAGDHVLAQLDADGTDYRFPLAVADSPSLADLRLEAWCKPVSGKVDQACGLVFRYRDAGDYYLVRANGLEDNVNLYKVVKGRRRQIEGWHGRVATGTWHALAVEARGDRLRVFWEGKPIIDARDDTFREAGQVGVWTKADSVTSFDALTATPLD